MDTGGWTVLGHVCLLGGGNVLRLLRNPGGGDLQHQTLREGQTHGREGQSGTLTLTLMRLYYKLLSADGATKPQINSRLKQ